MNQRVLLKRGNATIIILIFLVLGTFAYIYGLMQNPEHANTWGALWNDLWETEDIESYEEELDNQPYMKENNKVCTRNGDCKGNEICVSTRICFQGALDKNCDCFGTAVGSCKEFIATGGYIKTCSLGNQPCANDQRTGKVYPLCCPGYSCNNGRCEDRDGRCPFSFQE